MKKILYFLPIFFASFFFAACNSTPNYTISLDTSVLTMKVGDMVMLNATTTATDVKWSSDNESVATVFMGAVTAVGIGSATITASVDGAADVCLVSVAGKNGETLSITPAIVQINKGEKYQYTFISAYDVPLVWASSNPEVATVDQSGLVTAHAAGHTTISLTNGAETVTSNLAVPHTWGEYQLVWADEFNGTELDLNNWNIEQMAGGGNKEKQYYTDRPTNLRVENGNLVLQLQKEEYKNMPYTSARINTRDKQVFKYGKIEARIMFPSGGGTWPAFWMMGNDYRSSGWPRCGEIDIVEHIGNQPRMVSFALHTPYKNGTAGNNWSSRSYFDDVENQYHTYGIEWIEEENYGCDVIHFTYDGVTYATQQEDIYHIDENYYWPFNKDFFIIFNLAIGGTMGGNIDESIFDNNAEVLMKVDWVRVYQRQESE